MKTIQLIVFTASILFFSAACSNNEPKETDTPVIDVIPTSPLIAEQLLVLDDSVNSAWKAIIQLDSLKFANMKRLVQEISYCKKYDEKKQPVLII